MKENMVSEYSLITPPPPPNYLQEYLKEDFYQLFPSEVKPWDAMLLWGTKFSRSSLHMDPYNWTGTNAVLKGRKRWKVGDLDLP